MSKNLTRKGLALVSGTALALTSLVGVAAPASAAAGDVTMSPTTGTSYTVFNTDAMKLDHSGQPIPNNRNRRRSIELQDQQP